MDADRAWSLDHTRRAGHTRALKRDGLRDFIACYHPEIRRIRKASERLRFWHCNDLMVRHKPRRDIFWLKDDHLEAALAAFRDVAAALPRSVS